jgi:transcriptional regulator with XRE-family HTH domain
MVSSILYKTSKRLNVQPTILVGVQTRQEKLAEIVRQVRQQKGLSVRDVANASNGGISSARVSDVENCRIKDIQIETLKGLAKGLGIPAKELTDIMFGKPEAGTDERRLVWYFSHLPEEQRKNVLTMVEALYKSRPQQDAKPTHKERSKSSAPKVIRSISKGRDAIDEAIDAALAYGGKPISDKDRQTIREILEKRDKESEEPS